MDFRRSFTAAISLLLTLPVMAQFSANTALELKEGHNAHTSASNIYWNYKSPTDNATLIELKPINGSSITVYLGDASLPPQSQVMEYHDSKYYVLVGPEESVYISAQAAYTSGGEGSGFDAHLQVNTNLGLGFVPEYPIQIVNGGEYMISNGTTHTFDGELERYFSYTPEGDGTLSFGVSTFTSVRFANKNSADYTVVNGQYSIDDHLYHYDIHVNQGEPIMILAEVQAGNTRLIKTVLYGAGSGDGLSAPTAFLLENHNTVPTAYGSYWYRYDAKKSGHVLVSSQASMPGGQVHFYGTSTAYVEYSSQQGHFDLRFEVTAGMSYYVKVDKIETTREETPFETTFEEPQPGDSYTNPVVIQWDEAGKAIITTPAYCNQNYFYAVDLEGPDDTYELKVRCTTPQSQINTWSLLNVYPHGNMIEGSGMLYGPAAMTAGTKLMTDWNLAPGNGGSVPAGRYIVYIEKREYVPLTFELEKVTVEAGDLLSAPIVLTQVGMHEIPAKAEVYYRYTAPFSGRMSITLDDPQLEAQFYHDGYKVDVTRKGLEYSARMTQGDTYSFCITGGEEGFYTFTLAMEAFDQGESVDNPIPVSENIILNNEEVDVWYRYTVDEAGVLQISADLTDVNASVGYILNYQPGERPIETSIVNFIPETSDLEFKAQVSVQAGDVLCLHVRTSLPQPGLGVRFEMRGTAQGESIANPYVLTEDAPLKNFLTASRIQPIYIKVPVRAGKIRIWSQMLSLGTLYTDAALSQVAGEFSTVNVDYNADNVMCFYLDAQVSTPGDYYLTLTDGGGEYSHLWIEYRSGSAIEPIASDDALLPAHDLQGRQLSAPACGLLIRGGQKVLVR